MNKTPKQLEKAAIATMLGYGIPLQEILEDLALYWDGVSSS